MLMLTKVYSAAINGIDAFPVTIETVMTVSYTHLTLPTKLEV